MIKKLRKRVMVLLLILTMVAGMLPAFPADTVEAANSITEDEMILRVKDLATKLGLNADLSASQGVFFTTDGVSCGNNSCSNCKVGNIVQSAYFKKLFGYNISSDVLPYHYGNTSMRIKGSTCCGFANFALWYLGKDDINSNLFGETSIVPIVRNVDATKENLINADMKIGDIIYSGYTTSDGTNKYHSAIFLSYESNGIKVLDCNWAANVPKTKIEIHVWPYTHGYFTKGKMAVTRIKHYNPEASGPEIEDISIDQMDVNGFTVSCKVTDPDGVGAVYFPTWTSNNGQDDLATNWPQGIAQGNDWYSYRVNVAEHNYEYGWYEVHIYARDVYGHQTGPAFVTVDNSEMNPNPQPPSSEQPPSETPPIEEGMSTAEVTARIKDFATRMGLDVNLNYSNGLYFTADGNTCCGSSSCTNCKLNNVVSSGWFNNAFGFSISDTGILSRHYACEEMRVKGAGSCGFANVVLWYVGRDNNESNLYDESNIIPIARGLNFNEATLRSLNLKIGDVIYCNKSDGSAGRSAVFLDYEGNGIKVMDCNWGTDGTKMRSAIHVWEYNNADFLNGTMAITRLAKHNVNKDSAAPLVTNAFISNVDSTGYTVTATATDDIAVTKMSFAIRHASQSDEEWIWRDGTQNSDGSWSFRVNISEFGGFTGEYFTDVYAFDAIGNRSNTVRLTQYIDAQAPVISNIKMTNFTGAGYTIECVVTDDVAIDRVQFPTWTENKGQDDLLADWQTNNSLKGTVDGNVYRFRVSDTAHNYERGVYVTDIYAFDTSGNYSSVRCTSEIQNESVVVAEKTSNGHTYLLLDDKLTWQEAKDACEKMGGHLVTITSAEEQALVEDLLQEGEGIVGYFIGGYTEKRIFKWITAESTNYTNWYPGEPSFTDGENVCEIYTTCMAEYLGDVNNAGRWNDINSDGIGRGYICEIDPIQVSAITLSETKLELGINQSATLTVTIQPTNASHSGLVWTTSNPNVATVTKGVVTAVGAGKAIITVECGGKTAACEVNVVKPISSISLNATSLNMFKDESIQLSVAYAPADASGSRELVWSTTNPAVAVVDSNGFVRTYSSGKAQIIVKLKNNESVTATCDVTVQSYIVSFDTCGGNVIPSIEYGKGRLLNVEPPIREGFSFTGWYRDSACTDPWDMETDIVDRTMTLYAGWMEYHEGLWIVEIPEQEYTGKAIKPEVEVYHNADKLELGVDYSVSYKNNVNAADKKAGKAPTVTVTGKGNYSGKETATFTILSQSLNAEAVVIDNIYCPSNGKLQKKLPVVTWNGKKLKKDKDYTVSYPDTVDGAYVNVGTYKVVVTGKGNFSGTREIKLQITGLNLISKVKTSKIANQMYTGTALEPEFTVKYGPVTLTKGRDYEVRYENNISVGTADAIISGIGSYSGEKRVKFKIVGTPMNKVKVYNLPSVVTYDGTEKDSLTYDLQIVKNGITYKLVEGTDYTVTYKNNISVGTASVTFTGMNGYTGSLKKTFKITPYNIDADAMKAICVTDDFVAQYMKGATVIDPQVTFAGKLLINGKDYKLTFKNNKKVSGNVDLSKKPIVVITGKGNYSGSISYRFEIETQNISRLEMSATDKVFQNKAGKFASTPVIKDVNGKKLTAGTDFEKKATYTYTENTKLADGSMRLSGEVIGTGDIIPAGTSITAKVKGLGNYTGDISCTYRIVQADISKAKCSIPTQTYTGKEIKPGKDDISIKIGGVKLAKEDYEIVSYTNNVNKGTATVVIKGVGNYGGTKTIKFKIKSKPFSWWFR